MRPITPGPLGPTLAILLGCLGVSRGAAPSASTPPRPASLRDYREFALRREGDVNRGRDIFADEQRAGCTKCHAVDSRGGKAGPDLFAVGDKYGRREIIDSILMPSATIAVGYHTTTLVTREGEEVQGIVKEIADEWIGVMGGDGRLTRVATRDLREQRVTEVSLMPEGLQAGLSLEGFTDLVEYLVQLRQPESTMAAYRGMPREIPRLARPVALRPLLAEDRPFEHPVWIGPVPGEPEVLLVVEHETGKIQRLDRHDGGDARGTFVDLGHYDTGTRGLLGMALHPEFQRNRRYFFAKHVVEQGRYLTFIGERQAMPDRVMDSGQPTRILLRLDEDSNVHYGGSLGFGPGGFLYIGMGDSGPQEDPRGNGQNTARLLGKIMRIDVDHRDPDRPYAIPADNPFVGRPEFRPEIWAYGFREPWRFSFDPMTGDLWVGDVGQDRCEEVDIVRRGENLGWNVYEGFERFSNRYRRDGESYVPPVFAYARKFGPSVTGGFVYRADSRSPFYGVYIFGDYESRRLFGLTQTDRVLQTVREIGTAPQRVVSFGRGLGGELYVVGYEGMIYELDFREARFE